MIRVHNASVDDKFDGTPVRANDSIIVDEAAGSCALSLLDGGLGYFIIKRCSRAAVQWPVAGSRSSRQQSCSSRCSRAAVQSSRCSRAAVQSSFSDKLRKRLHKSRAQGSKSQGDVLAQTSYASGRAERKATESRFKVLAPTSYASGGAERKALKRGSDNYCRRSSWRKASTPIIGTTGNGIVFNTLKCLS